MTTTYVPKDWADAGKPITMCSCCGNRAPDVARSDRLRSPHQQDAEPDGARECSPCFIGRVLNEACSDDEMRELRREIMTELNRPHDVFP